MCVVLPPRQQERAQEPPRAPPSAPPLCVQFVMGLGITPLTGTGNPEHMAQDLAVLELGDLTPAEHAAIAKLIGEEA